MSSYTGKAPALTIPSVKDEKILKGSLDLIQSPSPSVKIQIMGGKPFAGNNF